MAFDVNELLVEAETKNASDMIFKVKSPPLCRVNGVLVHLREEILSSDDTLALSRQLTSEAEWKRFEKELELDIAYTVEGVGRFRVNLFKQRGSVGIVCRRIPNKIPDLDSIGIPEIAKSLAMRPRGLLLVTGPAGSGKSTTQAALIDYRNSNEDCHIMTVEDPIEFLHQDKKGLVNQRQVGRDTLSFANGLKYVLRQDPDVILIGEMRDLETIAMAITAAETGHLAIGTLHTNDAAQTIDRVVNAFPSHQQQQIRMQLSVNLIGVISQVLVNRADGRGRVAAFEILLATPAIRNVIREGKTFQIPQMLQMGSEQGMVSLEKFLAGLVKQKVITEEEAFSKTARPEELSGLLGTKPANTASVLF